jgi:hypothetical protein
MGIKHFQNSNSSQIKSSQEFNPHNSKSSAKNVCVRAGRCGAPPPGFRLLDGLTHISFLSHFSVLWWLLMLFFGLVEATFIPKDDAHVQFFKAPRPQLGPYPVSITQARR